MKTIKSTLFFIAVIWQSFIAHSQINPQDFPALRGPYLGQKPPGMTPEIFAPGIVSTEGAWEAAGSFSLDGNEFFFTRRDNIQGNDNRILYMALKEGNGLLRGPFLGQTPPGNQSKVFAPGFVSTEFIAGQRPVEDVFTVMEMVANFDVNPLWPNFRTSEIPVLVFDSINTWLFHSKVMPEGFSEVREHPKVYRFPGQHPLVRGNSIVRMGDTWVATSAFSSYARRTGEKYCAKDLAGIIIHEQFHIFSKTRHTKWQQNDGYLLLYPTETPESLLLRRLEKEAFRRAVVASTPGEIAGWAQEALNYRKQRLDQIAPVFATYEKELQRTEGLSDYIERVARGSNPLDASNITDGIAPAGVRDLGYVEGRWIAMILDKLNSYWKLVLEDNDANYLEDILTIVINDPPYDTKNFTKTEVDKLKSDANIDFMTWQEKKKKEIDQFNDLPGYRIEINALAKPLNIWIFEPLEIEILDDRSVFHRVIFSAGNEAGSLRIRDLPCSTGFDNSLRVTGMQIHGLSKGPEINELEKTMKLTDGSSTLDLKYSRITINGSMFTVEL